MRLFFSSFSFSMAERLKGEGSYAAPDPASGLTLFGRSSAMVTCSPLLGIIAQTLKGRADRTYGDIHMLWRTGTAKTQTKYFLSLVCGVHGPVEAAESRG